MIKKVQTDVLNTNKEINAMKPIIQQLETALDNMLKADIKNLKDTAK